MSRRLSDKAYEDLKQKIINLELVPGQLINESRLSEELEIGRTPLREAVLRLAKDDLVTVLPRRSMCVSDIGIADLGKICEIRAVLEALCHRLAAQRITQTQVAEIDRLLGEQAALAEDDFVGIDDFHRKAYTLVHDAADNRFLRSELERLYAHSARIWNSLQWRQADNRIAVEAETRRRHVEILGAVKARDAERAAALIHQQILGYQEGIRAVLWRVTHT